MPDPDTIFDLPDNPPADDPGLKTPTDPPVDPPEPDDQPEGDEPEVQPDPDDSPEGDQPDGDLPDQYASDEEYLRDQGYYGRGLPEHIKTLDEALSYGLNMSQQANRSASDAQKLAAVNQALSQQGIMGGVDAFLAGGGRLMPPTQSGLQSQQSTQGSFFPQSPNTDILEKQLREYPGTRPEDAAYLRQQAARQDQAYQEFSKPLITVIGGIAQQMQKFIDFQNDTQYRFLSKKMREAVPRYELDAIVNSGRAKNYEEAFIEFARLKRPDLLAALYAPKGGPAVPGTPNARRPASLRVAKKTPQKDPMAAYGKYLGPDGEVDERKLPKDINKQVEILEAIAKLTKSA